MTTRAGFAGLITGLVLSLLLAYPLYRFSVEGVPSLGLWSAVIVAAILTIGGGAWAGRWSGARQPLRCAALGGLAGSLAGTLAFCFVGAAAAGLSAPAEMAAIVGRTESAFLASFGVGSGLGLLGGWLACPRPDGPVLESFDKIEPQMALNAAITAVPASVFAAFLATIIFSRLADLTGGNALARSEMDLPLAVALLLTLVSQFALALVAPHEAREAEHRCGLDEVKMAAYVAVGAAPVLSLLLFLVDPVLFSTPLVVAALLVSAGMSLKSLQTLLGQILPRRASFPAPQDNRQRVEAQLFGTIAASLAPRLVVLCLGCGLLMILPLHVTVIAPLVNLNSLLLDPALSQLEPDALARQLFLAQALVSGGLMTVFALALIALYLFYLNLGRWFNRWNARQRR